jgi:molecular chaperone DnaJ
MNYLSESYKALGLTEDAEEAQIEEAYLSLRGKYSEDRFLEGDAGYEGAQNLTRVEQAYAEIKRSREKVSEKIAYGSDLGAIDAKIIAGDLDLAQADLDAVADRDSEWYYLQSILFYKRGWLLESHKQLKMAVSLAPYNRKYSDALTRLETVMGAPEVRTGTVNQGGFGGQNQGGGQNVPPQRDSSMGVLNCCSTLCLLDCCCSTLRCC